MVQNKDIILKFFDEGWENQNFEPVKDYFGNSILFHVRETTQELDLNKTKMIISRWKKAFPDLRFEVLDIIEEGDLVATNTIMLGTHKGVWRGIDPTGKQINVPHMFFFRLEDGKLVEIWEVNDFTPTVEDLRGE